jgi:methyl-accepting chemotaxis protein
MFVKLNDKLIRMCMEHSKTLTINEAKETSTETAHATDKLDRIADKLHRIHDMAKILSDNTETNDEISEQVAITNEPIHSHDALDVIDARLGQIVDKLTQATGKPKRIADEPEQAIHKLMDLVATFGEMIHELSDTEKNARLLLKQLRQSVNELTYAVNQLTQAIDESASNESQSSC